MWMILFLLFVGTANAQIVVDGLQINRLDEIFFPVDAPYIRNRSILHLGYGHYSKIEAKVEVNRNVFENKQIKHVYYTDKHAIIYSEPTDVEISRLSYMILTKPQGEGCEVPDFQYEEKKELIQDFVLLDGKSQMLLDQLDLDYLINARKLDFKVEQVISTPPTLTFTISNECTSIRFTYNDAKVKGNNLIGVIHPDLNYLTCGLIEDASGGLISFVPL